MHVFALQLPIADLGEQGSYSARSLQNQLPNENQFFQGNNLNIIKTQSFIPSLLVALTLPACASVTVNSPVSGNEVHSPFKLSAISVACSSQPVASMGYSFDNSTSSTIINGTTIDAEVVSSTGPHTLHVKSWGDKGAGCDSDVQITVTSTSSSESVVPTNASRVSSLQTFGDWHAVHDSGTRGDASGHMSLAGSPSMGGTSRRFVTDFSRNGGERYSLTFADDDTATNFMYDGWVYFTSSARNIGNLEMDLNQVMPNGHTVIFGFQCSAYSGTWEYTKNAGSASHYKPAWVSSHAGCNPRTWSVNAWHHVQINYSRNDSGVVTYHSVWLDGKESAINGTVFSEFDLGWPKILNTNFQVDGEGSGSNTIYLDNLTIYRW